MLSKLIFVTSAYAVTLAEWMNGDQVPSDLRISQLIAQEEDLETLSSDFGVVTLFLPTDESWCSERTWPGALVSDDHSELRYDMFLASSAEVDVRDATGSWLERLSEIAEDNWGVIDSGYGVSYIIKGNKELCLSEYENGNYVPKRCVNIRPTPVVLEDAAVFQIEGILLPAELEGELEDSDIQVAAKISEICL